MVHTSRSEWTILSLKKSMCFVTHMVCHQGHLLVAWQKKAAVFCRIWYVARGISWMLGLFDSNLSLVIFGRRLVSFVRVHGSVAVVRGEQLGKDVEHVSYFQFRKDKIIATKKTAVYCHNMHLGCMILPCIWGAITIPYSFLSMST